MKNKVQTLNKATEEKVVPLHKQFVKRDHEMSHLMELIKSLQAQVSGSKHKESASMGGSFEAPKTQFARATDISSLPDEQ